MTVKRSQTSQKSENETSLKHDQVWRQSRWRSDMRRKLLAWFSDHAREMPWRSDPKPYHVWVSEIMLQQTQVATVLPYYERWIKSFPTVNALAKADEATLMRHWEGLGYYRRVKSMHAAAKQIVANHDGVFPDDYESVLALPGVGRYTAGAVLSISSDARLPVLEGNTQRVYSRWIALQEPPMEKAANQLLWHFAETMLPRNGSGQFNQAAMELGALVCVPRTPKCDECPVAKLCRAKKQNLELEIPGKIKRIEYEDKSEFAMILSRQSRNREEFLVRPLPDGGRWAGLWDFPRCTDDAVEALPSAADWLSQQLGKVIVPGARLKTMRHAVTKYRIELHVHQATFGKQATSSKTRLPKPWRWVTLEEMGELPMSVTGRKIADFLYESQQPMLPLE